MDTETTPEPHATRTDYLGPKDNARIVFGPCSLRGAVNLQARAYTDSRTMGPYDTTTPIKYDISGTIMYGTNHPPSTGLFQWGEQCLSFNHFDSGQQVACGIFVEPWMDLSRPFRIQSLWMMNDDPAPYVTKTWRAGAWVYAVPHGVASDLEWSWTSGTKSFSGAVFAHQYDRVPIQLDSFVPAVDMPLITAGDYITFFISRRGGEIEDDMDVEVFLTKVYIELYQKHTT